MNLKQRLRGLASFYAMMAANVDAPNERDAYEQTSGLATEAADAIERLEAENARLRATIERVEALTIETPRADDYGRLMRALRTATAQPQPKDGEQR